MTTSPLNPDVQIWVEGTIGRFRLNRPKALNALNAAMCEDMLEALRRWQNDDGISAVIIDASGEKAFCAGGDIRELYYISKEQPNDSMSFWWTEYQLNSLIARYPKPYIAIMDGITMGGGVGVSAHGSHRIVTEHTTIAMPEVAIGYLPDVGGTWLLAQAPGHLGTYMGMTGARAKAADAIYLGLADHFIERANVGKLIADIVSGTQPNKAIEKVATPPPASTLKTQQNTINKVFGQNTPHECVAALWDMAETGDEWAKTTVSLVEYAAPFSIAAAHEAIKRARQMTSVDEALAQEYRYDNFALTDPNFFEGVRAMVIDKDKQPKWSPATLDEVKSAQIARAFDPLIDGDWKPEAS